MTTSTLYPLLLERKIVQPIWGGEQLAAWLDLPEPRPTQLGETWQVYDTNPILNGPLAGQTLAQATQQLGAQLVGTRTIERYGRDFPLLAKFIDANDKLSIQVHPTDDYAHSHEAATGFHGKTEAWYILDAQPGANVIYGLERQSNRSEFASAVESGELEPLMHYIPVSAGDVIFVPAGTLHAINAGIVLFEIQEKSDLTYRVYDYGRRDAKTGKQRELHLEKALEVTEFAPPPRSKIEPLPMGDDRTLLIACSYFALERWRVSDELTLATNSGTFEILTLLEGRGTLHGGGESAALRRGDSAVLPAALGNYTLRADGGEIQMLRAYVPDLERDLAAPLRARGVDPDRIGEVVIQ